MKVLVTGGTGFVGSHTVKALIDAGHDVRLLVRNAARVDPALGPLGIAANQVETVAGDVTHAAAVAEALRSCDAVVHAASVYSFDSRLAEAATATNVAGTELVLRSAADAGLNPIVHVSSMVALMAPGGNALRPDTEPGHPHHYYARSKAEADRRARRLQSDGAPIVITHPGSVWGPNDPYWGESCRIAEQGLGVLGMVAASGGFSITDVRDLATLHAMLLERRGPPWRVIPPSHFVRYTELLELMENLTGRKRLRLVLPSKILYLQNRYMFDPLQKLLPLRLPGAFNSGPLEVLMAQPRLDDSETRALFGVAPRPLQETVADQIRWMAASGRLSGKLAGRLAATA